MAPPPEIRGSRSRREGCRGIPHRPDLDSLPSVLHRLERGSAQPTSAADAGLFDAEHREVLAHLAEDEILPSSTMSRSGMSGMGRSESVVQRISTRYRGRRTGSGAPHHLETTVAEVIVAGAARPGRIRRGPMVSRAGRPPSAQRLMTRGFHPGCSGGMVRTTGATAATARRRNLPSRGTLRGDRWCHRERPPLLPRHDTRCRTTLPPGSRSASPPLV